MKIRCSQCGECCCDPVIEVTHHDIRRLVKHTGISADRLIRLHAKSDFDSVDDSDLIKFSYGNRKISLRKNKNGACLFLSEDRQCTAYEARPMSCRIFPIDVFLDDENKASDFELSDVIRDKFIKCKYHYGKSSSYKSFRLKAIQSGNETASYWGKIKQWNRRSEKGGKSDFLNFMGFKVPE
ncbi:MAG: YkgJ family cysteine cluster protein [Nitrospirae bacterium]|nr:YkgJ family cysteine cluster protein [Nitrospirota bacterium]